MKSGMHINDVIADCNDMRILLSKLKEEPLTYDNVALIKSFVAKYDKQYFGSILECAQEQNRIDIFSKLTDNIYKSFDEEIIKKRINEFYDYCKKEYNELQWDKSLPPNDSYSQYCRITSALKKYQKLTELQDATIASKRKTAIEFINAKQLECKLAKFQKVIAICKVIIDYCEVYVKDINIKNDKLGIPKMETHSLAKNKEELSFDKKEGRDKVSATAPNSYNRKEKKGDNEKLHDIAYNLFPILCSNGQNGVFTCKDENDLYQFFLFEKPGCDYKSFVRNNRKQMGYWTIRSISDCLTNEDWFSKMCELLGSTISEKTHESFPEITKLFDPYRETY